MTARNHLSFNKDNTMLSCGCGAVSCTTRWWNSATDHAREALSLKAQTCSTCIADARRDA